MSPNEAGFNLREKNLLFRNLHRYTGQRPYSMVWLRSSSCRGWSPQTISPKDETGDLIYPVSGRDTAKSGIGCNGNRRLSDLAAVQFRERGRLKAKCQDEQSINVRLERRSVHSSLRLGKPATWRRGAVCWNSGAQVTECEPGGISWDVGGTQRKLSR